jgi:hypothetical protein
MKIEPCPFCGSELRYSLGTLSTLCKNPECLYEGPIDDENAQKHNRLSRIVRAAEKWAKARRTGTMLEISETGNELLLAVEGGTE